MRRVITVSLNGNAYALEEDAAEALSAYLESARQALEQNADRDEILADLEQAIADKSQRFLGAHKTVLSRAEISQVLGEMGPVSDDSAGEQSAAAEPSKASQARTTRGHRLFRIRQGQQVSGVCNGLAAYFGIDVTWIRLAFILCAFGGVSIFVYFALIIVMPVAKTPEDLAAAYGEPFNAREYVERARREANRFANADWSKEKAELKAEWDRSKSFVRTELRDSLRSWRQSRSDAQRRRRAAASAATQPVPTPMAPHYPARPGALQQLLTILLSLPLIVLFAGLAGVWILAMFALVTTGTLFGFLLPIAAPVWVTVLLLVCAFWLITWPLRLLLQVIASPGNPASLQPAFSALESLVGVAAFLAIVFWAHHHVAPVGEAIDAIAQHLSMLIERLFHHGSVEVNT
jgi:phage shock protein PspC (stress-responsive transcriptional regulator)